MTEGPGSDHSFRDPRATKKTNQRIINESWPFHDSNGAHARGLEDKPADQQVDVVVRVEFSEDGEMYLEGRAIRWNRSHVCVTVNDKRLLTSYLWVRAHDVRRRDAGST